VTRRTFLKLVGATSAALYVGAVKLRVIKDCPLCAEGFAHFPESTGFACRWREVNSKLAFLPERWYRR